MIGNVIGIRSLPHPKFSQFWNVLSSSEHHHISPTGLTFAIGSSFLNELAKAYFDKISITVLNPLLRPIHSRGFAPGACSRGTLLEQGSSVYQQFHRYTLSSGGECPSCKCSTILNQLHIWEQAPWGKFTELEHAPLCVLTFFITRGLIQQPIKFANIFIHNSVGTLDLCLKFCVWHSHVFTKSVWIYHRQFRKNIIKSPFHLSSLSHLKESSSSKESTLLVWFGPRGGHHVKVLN